MEIPLPRFLVLLISLLLSFTANAQFEDLTQDKVFFQNQEKTYQKWLDHSGLGKTLQVQSTIVKSDELILYLQFPFTDTDSVTNAWNTLKIDFEKKNPLELEQELFYKMISIMEIRESFATIQLYDTYDTRVEYCFKRKVFSQQGEVKTEKEICKAKIRHIDFDPTDFSRMKSKAVLNVNKTTSKTGMTPLQIRQHFPKQEIFDRIYTFAKDHFEQTTCENRNPKVTLINSKGVLRFKVTDLCKVVLKDGNPKVCEALQWWGYECNWIKRERLIFTITYEETPEGFNVNCIIDGAYGSGYYEKVRRGGYHNMEVDFDDELEEYADIFKEKIRELITK